MEALSWITNTPLNLLQETRCISCDLPSTERAKTGSAFAPARPVHRLAQGAPLKLEICRRVKESPIRPVKPSEVRLKSHHLQRILEIGPVVSLVEELSPGLEHAGHTLEEFRVIEKPPPMVAFLWP